jgi:putative endonuclease
MPSASPRKPVLAHLRRAATRVLRRTPAPLGLRGERHAARFLRRAGYKIIARNLHIGPGEADLVAVAPDRRTLVIVEVKTRLLGGPHPEPERSITSRKRAKLLGVARAVRGRARWRGRPIRIDVIAIDWPMDSSAPIVRHYQNAVIQGR